MSTNVVTVIQARCGSSRLPNKVMKEIEGKPLILRMLERVARAKLTGTIVAAIPENPQDDELAKICQDAGYAVFRGHETDLLDRHYQVAKKFAADIVVKIPSDCPLIDSHVIDHVLAVYLRDPEAYDYISNLHPPTHPDGNDVEVFSMQALEAAWKEASKEYEREHTTPFFWTHPHRFRLANVAWETGLDFSKSHRFVLDYAEDFTFVEAVYAALYTEKPKFTLMDILALLKQKPELREINQKYLGDAWYQSYSQELGSSLRATGVKPLTI